MIHQYINNGFHIIMDVNSGSVHSVDPVMYDAVAIVAERVPELAEPEKLSEEVAREVMERLSPTYGEAEVQEALDEIQYLIDAEELLTTDQYHDYVVDFKKRKTVVKALCLHIAHDCNLACQYCFAEEGEYHGRRALMSFEVGKKALDFLIANSGNRRNLEVDFFGGEPLMNWEVVKQLVEYGRSKEKEYNKNFRFTMTTNGVLLNDEIMDYCNREMSNVVLSLDGRKEVNDKMRPFRGGKGSFDLIVPKFQKFAEMRGDRDYYVRGTFTRHNLDFSKDVTEFADLGFRSMSIEPVVAKPEEEYAIREEDLPQIMEEYDHLAEEYIKRKKEGRGFNFFHFNIDLNQGPCVAKRLSGCGSGTEYLAVTPWGDLYPCHQFVGKDEFKQGSVLDQSFNMDIAQKFAGMNIYSRPKCQKCWAKFYCSGGCSAANYNMNHDMNDSYDLGCEMERKRLECAIYLKAMDKICANQSK